MFRLIAIVLPLSIAASLGSLPSASAATPAVASPAASKEIVRYRLADWRAVHTSNEAQAKKLAATLSQLKCEVQQSSHGNHIDVRYRCKGWQELQLKDHASAHQWEQWLKKYGFETTHHH
ncbi:hypothetical protein [Candidatus Laterigemmans baculatus]|nr:hypothetical protein [Candidatus Laterigemmans baculatus]